MLMYVISVYMIFLVVSNFVFSKIMYKKPPTNDYDNNVKEIVVTKERFILPDSKYVLGISILVGIVMGLYLALCKYAGTNSLLSLVVVIFVAFFYLFDMTRGIHLDEEKIMLQHGCGMKKTIPLKEIKGMFVYSYNKKFLLQHALTTKLVVTTRNEKQYVYTISSLNYKKVLNMMKENFGIISHKMYVYKQDK